jgi:hypothetical protein
VVEEKPVEVIEERPLDDGLSWHPEDPSCRRTCTEAIRHRGNRHITLEPQP